jgi:predicted nucleotidyltransferase
MKKHLLNISGKIDSNRLAAIEKIANVANSEDIPFFLVGAMARDLIFFEGHNINTDRARATLDIDIGVRVPGWIQYNKLKEELVRTGEFKEDKEFQRLIFRNRLKVDLIPFGPIADKSGKIRWPHNDEIVMQIIGFEEAFANSQTLRLRDSPILEIKAVTLAGLAVMKILSSDTKDKLLEIIDREAKNQEESKLIVDMYTSKVFIEADFNRLLGLLDELKRGILERL